VCVGGGGGRGRRGGAGQPRACRACAGPDSRADAAPCASHCVQSEERRSRALQPYLVTTPKRGIVGNSTYAGRLRRQVRRRARAPRGHACAAPRARGTMCVCVCLSRASPLRVDATPLCVCVGVCACAGPRRQIVSAAKDPARKPCLVFGEPGLQKDNVAALLHFGSPSRTKPLIQVALRGCWECLCLAVGVCDGRATQHLLAGGAGPLGAVAPSWSASSRRAPPSSPPPPPPVRWTALPWTRS
jgi:hypothetical protein